MAIAQMEKVIIVTHRSQASDLLEALQHEGICQILNAEEAIVSRDAPELATQAERPRDIEKLLNRLTRSIEFLKTYAKPRKGLASVLAPRAVIDSQSYNSVVSDRQLINVIDQAEQTQAEIEQLIYSPRFLIKRPLLEAILRSEEKAPVLLIDEIDRSDEEFEAFLLEVLSDFQITIPELGTMKAKKRPLVVVTSNRTREIHDALKRRCLYHWIEYPSFEKEYQIIMTRLPGIESRFAEQVARFMQELRTVDFFKRPGISETLDWAQALLTMQRNCLDEKVIMETLGCILKYQEDILKFKEEIWSGAEARAAFI